VICKNPYSGAGGLFGCGQCLPCRLNRRRQWTWRQWFESLCHEENCFVTLTYAPGKEPGNAAHDPHVGRLQPVDVQLFLKRLRKSIYPGKVRFFAVGEYGERSGRPHYHLSLFGLSRDEVVSRPQAVRGDEVFGECPSWGLGLVHAAPFTEQTAQYTCGYVIKKMTHVDDRRLHGRPPEFARMSRRPGIGTAAMEVIAASLGEASRRGAVDADGALSTQVRVGRRLVPLGRFLLRKLRAAAYGEDSEEARSAMARVTYERSLELSALLSRALASGQATATKKAVYLEEVKQKTLQIESRAKMYSKKEVL